MANALRCFRGLSLLLTLYLIQSISTSRVISLPVLQHQAFWSPQVYIVYLGRIYNHDPFLISEYHLQLLTNIFQSKEEAMQAMLYSYKYTFSGFAATLNASQATILKNTRGVISVFESKILQLHTTRSWDFMGLTLDYSQGTPLQLTHGDGIIVGVFDTGVWPESASFMEEASMGPIPKCWRGRCDPGEEFNPKKACNKKLIGAKYFLKGFEKRYGKINNTRNHEEYISARDYLGHGTHTASTAVGSRAQDANLFGFGRGVARGGAPRARLAVYKVCWSRNFDGTCTEEDVMAAFDEALNDGVHVISVSFGKVPPLRAFFTSSADIGSFHAMQLGVSVVFSAGNDGPDMSTVGNVNPWSICVAASSMDRSFPTKILVDDGSLFVGEGLITNHIRGTLANARSYFSGGVCNIRNWKNISLSGMVLMCFWSDGGVMSEDAEFVARRAKAAALIFVQPLTRPVAALSIVPVVRIDVIQGTKLHLLPNCTKVHILPSETALRRSPAPMVSDFSSRGPSSISPDFLKPDISAPGINIMAAWPPYIPPSVFPGDERSVVWNFNSGTSMSCPHVSAAVALLKSAHPHWSPAAIRSALITTAYNTDINGDGILVEASEKSCDPFDIGAGHLNPIKAMDPGLIYDMTNQDYLLFLCNSGYSRKEIQAMVMCPLSTCRPCPQRGDPNWNINYPSVTVSNLRCTTTIKRSLRNVGHMKIAVYFVTTVNPNGVEVVVWPKMLIFTPWKEEVTYYVTLKPLKISEGRYDFGSITWSDGFHKVRSPLVVQVSTSGAEIARQDTSANMDY